jgi:hypothetical protein
MNVKVGRGVAVDINNRIDTRDAQDVALDEPGMPAIRKGG